MKIALGADHAGYQLKDELIETVRQLGHEPLDCGGDGSDPTDDYPDYAEKVGDVVRTGEADRGILVCGSGVGVSIAASKIPGIRAAICHDTYSAHQGVEHDDMNVLVLGERVIGSELARDLVRAYLAARFSGEARHVRRLNKVMAIQERYSRQAVLKPEQTDVMILAGDIGGTSTRLAYFEAADGQLKHLQLEKFPSRKYRGLEEIVREFVRMHPATVEQAAFGIAGPVQGGRVEATNLPWVVDCAGLAEELGTPAVRLLNDLEANAYGVFELAASDFAVINAGNTGQKGNVAVISAGTGLGEAGAVWDGTRHIIFATEGGHTDFAPRDELESELMLYVHARLGGRVSYERILSGPGLYTIYQFLRDTGRGGEEHWLREELAHGDSAAIVSQHALDGSSELCVRTLDLFVTLYGAEAGNLALKLMALGGIFIGGGIAPKIISKMTTGRFMNALASKGRFEPLLRSLPVRVLLNDDAALLGAARYATLETDKVQL